MPEDQPNSPGLPEDQSSEPPPQDAPPKRRKRRKWPWVIASLLVLLLLFVLLVPTIVSSSAGRNAIVGIVNGNLNGRAEIGGLSVSWFSPTQVTGIKVYNDENRLILDVPRAKINLSLVNVLRQKFDLGNDSQIDIASFILNVDRDGKTNFEKLVKTTAKEPSDEPVQIPQVKGKITVIIDSGTVEGEGVQEVVHVRPSSAVVTITDINQTITNDVKLAYVVGDGEQVSTIQASGTIDAIKNNVLDIAGLKAGQAVALNHVNLAVLEPFLKKLGPDTRLAGQAQGKLDVKAEGLTGITASGTITISSVEFSGGPIGADTFRSSTIDIPVNITRDGKLIRFDNVGATTDQLSFRVTGQVEEQALLNLANNKPPGGSGSITITTDIPDVSKLTSQLRETLRLQEQVQVQRGSLNQRLVFTINPDSLNASVNMEIKDVAGTRDGQPVALKPITVAAQATALPRGTPVPDVKDVKLDVASAFATVTGGGDLGNFEINGNFDLARLRQELAQFVELPQAELAGSGMFKIMTRGDLADQSKPILTSVYASLAGANSRAPLLELNGNAQVVPASQHVPWFEIDKFYITDLKQFQQQFGGLVSALAENRIRIDSGSVNAKVKGSFNGTTLALSEPLAASIDGLTVSKDARPLLSNETLAAAVDGSVSLKDGIDGKFTALSLTSRSKLFDLNKSGTGDLTFTMTRQAVRGAGTMSLAADLPRLATIAQAFGGATEVSPDTPQLTAGQLNGTLVLAKQDLNHITFNGNITGLTIATAGTNQLENETLALALNASAADDLASKPVEIDGTIKSKIVNANLTDVRIAPQARLYEMLRSANISAQAPDLPMLMALVNSFAPVLGDLQVTSGGATVKMAVARNDPSNSTTIDIPDCRVSKLRIRRGAGKPYVFDPNNPISLKLKAALTGSDRLETVTVDELSGDLRVASLTMPRKLVMKMGEKPSYDGAVKLEGKIDDVAPLLAVLQGGEPLPYGGAYVVNQQITTSGDIATLVGTGDISNFQVLDKGKPVFTEPQVAVRNDLAVDLKQQKVAVKTLTVEMPQSKALAASFTGGVNFWLDRREVRQGTKLDLTYDLAQLWKILYPMLTPEQQVSYKDLKVAGRHTKSFTLSGAFPSKDTFAESIKSLNADGSFAVDRLETMGLSVQKLEPQVKMTRGVVKLYSKPAEVNGGRLDIDAIVLDLTQPNPLLTVPPKKVVLENVALNPILARTLGKAGAVLFTDATTAEGQLKLTVVECNQLPVTALTGDSSRARAQIELEIDSLYLDGPVPFVLSKFARLGTDGFRGKVPPGTIKIQNGVAESDLTVLIARRVRDQRGRETLQGMPMTFTGGLGLARLDLRNFVVSMPLELVNPNWERYAPNGLKLPLKGLASKPHIDESEIIKSNVGGFLEGVLGGDRDRSRDRGR